MVHDGSGEAVLMVSAGFTVTVKLFVAGAPTVSVAVMLNMYGVGATTVGVVPVSPPAAESESHPGRFELVNPIAPVPPLAASCCEYPTPLVVGGSGLVVVI